MNHQNNRHSKKLINFIRYSSLGMEMMTIIALGTYGGYKLDQWMENKFKGFTLGLMIFSVIIALIYGLKGLLKK